MKKPKTEEDHLYRVEARYMGEIIATVETTNRQEAAQKWMKWDEEPNTAAVLFVDGERVRYIRCYKALGMKEK